MMVFAAIVVHVLTTLIQVFGLVRAAVRVRLYAAFLAGLLLYQVLSLASIGYFLEEFGADVLIHGELVILSGTLMILISIEFFETLIGVTNRGEPNKCISDVIADPGRYLVIAGSSFLFLLIVMTSRGSVFLDSNWEELRPGLGFLDSVATLLQFIAFPVVWILFRLGRRHIALFSLVLALAVFAAYGSRAALLTIPATIGLDYYYRGLLFDRRYMVFGSAFVVLLVIVLHVGGRIIRGLGLGGVVSIAQGDFSSIVSLLEDPEQIDWSGGESSIMYYFLFVIREGSIQGIEHLSSVLRWLTMYLPRALAPDLKPIDATYSLWVYAANAGVFDGKDTLDKILDIVRQGDMGSLHALFWGEAWMNGGVSALVTMCVLLGCCLVIIEYIYSLLPATVVALIAPATVIGYLMVARGNSVIGLGYIAYLLPFALVGYLCLSIFWGPSNNQPDTAAAASDEH
jgi:hypothetical protein